MQRSKLILLALVAMLTICSDIKAQDIHFSQFYASPLTLNPALTGNLNGSYRFTAIYRNQYAQVPVPYETVGASFDMPALRTALKSDHVGLGLQIFNDRSGDGNLNNVSILGSVAYHKSLDRWQKYYVSLGIQGGYTQYSINFANLIFPNQITDGGPDPSIANGEPVQAQTFDYFDFNTGLLFSGNVSDNVSFYAGGAFYHFTQPIQTFLGSDNRLSSRYVVHAGSEIFVNKQVSISPSALFMTQASVTEVNVGAALGYHFLQNSRNSPRTALYVGGWFRVPHEIIFMGGLDYKNFRFGISYDLAATTGLKDPTEFQGGFEVAMQYIGSLFDPKRKYPLLYCPRF